MLYVNAKIFYRGSCPTKEYIKFLEKKFKMRFVKVELEPIMLEIFTFESAYVSHIICPGNFELTLADTLYCSYVE